VDPEYLHAATGVGRHLAERGIGLVYGGGNVGLMGAAADAALEAGGEVFGVIPRSLVLKEVAHRALTRLHVVESMHERKALMNDLSDGFIVLPGGIGTLEEMFEILRWGSLGLHAKPLGVLNVKGFYDPLMRFPDRTVEEGFLKPKYRSGLIEETDIAKLIDRMSRFDSPHVRQWIDRETS
jgi:uncharacterized protein (TIGR00730 family)